MNSKESLGLPRAAAKEKSWLKSRPSANAAYRWWWQGWSTLIEWYLTGLPISVMADPYFKTTLAYQNSVQNWYGNPEAKVWNPWVIRIDRCSVFDMKIIPPRLRLGRRHVVCLLRVIDGRNGRRGDPRGQDALGWNLIFCGIESLGLQLKSYLWCFNRQSFNPQLITRTWSVLKAEP